MKHYLIQFYKAFLFILLLTFFSESNLLAQCGTEITGATPDPVTADYTAQSLTLRVYFVLIRRSDGSGDIQYSTLSTIMNELDSFYSPHNITFVQGCVRYIDSTAMYNNGCIVYSNLKDLGKIYASYDGITVFLQVGYCGNISGQAGTFPSFPQPYCWAQYPGVANGVSHEVGHTLNLYHTDFMGFYKPCVGVAAHDTTRGDLVADTPIDYAHSEPVVNCAWDTSQCRNRFPNPCLDSCGGFLLDVDPTIIMSNVEYDCTDHFTTGQANRMKKSIMGNTNGSFFEISTVTDTINGIRTISTPTNLGGDVYIGNDDTLIITSTVTMPSKGRIIMVAGAVLQLNGGTITKNKILDVCGERVGDAKFWRGIEMNMSASGPYPKFYCTNGTIEFSELGIHNATKAPGNAHISINGGTFRNNKRSINVIRARLGGTLPIIVKKARFYVDTDFPLSTYSTQVKIDNSKIMFDSCRFDNPANRTSPGDTTYCIRSFNTDLSVQHSTFKDSLYGVQASSLLSTATIGVTLTKFSKMFIGINTNGGVNNYSITKDTVDTAWKYGLLSTKCSGYVINNNHFKRTNTYTNSVGILMSESGTALNTIQLNKFVFLKHGNISSGDNSGLQYLCNENENRVTSDLFLKGYVSDKQGSSANAAGNKALLDNVTLKLDSLSLNKLIYYYKDTADQVPIAIPDSFKLTRTKVTNSTCLLKGKPKYDTVPYIVVYQEKKDTMNIRKDTHADSIDGGNTADLLSFIAGATSGTATSLYNQLIYRSPWLSSAVVLAAYNRTDIFDSTKRANILFENPDLFVSREFREALSDADSPLPESSLNALDTLTNYTTIRTDLEAEIAELNLDMNELCYSMLHQLKIDTLDHTDSILVWLDRADDYSSRREIMELHYSNGDYTEAYDALDDLGAIDDKTASEESDVAGLTDLVPYMEDVKDDDRYEGYLSEEEIEWMIDFAEENNNQAGREVRAVLDFYYGIILDGAETFLKRPTDHAGIIYGEKAEQKPKSNSNEVSIFPNPSQSEITIILPIIEKSHWDIQLLDLNGKLLVSGNTDGYKLKLDISKIPNGVYLIHLLIGSNERIIKRIQIIK